MWHTPKSQTPKAHTPKLERRNAQRYDNEEHYTTDPPPGDLYTRSLGGLPSYGNRASIRIRGASAEEVDAMYRNLDLTGPEDFAIPADAWEAHKSRSASARLPPSRPFGLDDDDEGPDDLIGEAEEGIRGPRPPPLESPGIRTEMEEVGDGVEEVEVGDGVRVEEEKMEIGEESGGGDEKLLSDWDGAVRTVRATETVEYVITPGVRVERTIADWTLGKELGRGSFGTVYEAINHDGFFFAVKEVSLLDQGPNAQQCIQQLEQEIALLSHFEHENIVRYLGTEKEEAKLFIFLELVTQGSLASLYHKYQLRDSQVSSYTRQILHGLKYLHAKKVVHRDIKCANILVDASGSVKLADFGLAKQTSELIGLRSCKGSVYWMAPEVVKPKRPYGSAADIWSLGCTVLEMLTQNLPYPNLEWTQAMFKIGRGERPEIPESLSSDARDFISQCLQSNPEDRPDARKLLDHPFVRKQHSNGIGSDGSSHGRRVQAT